MKEVASFGTQPVGRLHHEVMVSTGFALGPQARGSVNRGKTEPSDVTVAVQVIR